MKGSGGFGDLQSLHSRTGLSSISIWIVFYFAGVLHKMAMNLLGNQEDGPRSSTTARREFAPAKETRRSYDPVSTITASRIGPCAPWTRIFSMSAVRLEPLITQA